MEGFNDALMRYRDIDSLSSFSTREERCFPISANKRPLRMVAPRSSALARTLNAHFLSHRLNFAGRDKSSNS